MRRTPWDSLRAEHRQAVGRVVETVDGLDEAAWLRAPAPGKWCPAQVVEHLLLSYDALLRELGGAAGMRLRASWWRRFVIRLRYLPMVLDQGRLPEGAPAVREIRPASPARARPAATHALRERAERFDAEITRAFEDGTARLTHPFFGRLRAPQALRFVAVHLEHHRKQIAPRNQAG